MPEHALRKLLGDLQPSLALSNKKLSEYESLTLLIQDYFNMALSDIMDTNHSCDGGDTAAVLFSGGTTGIPKHINHSHKFINFMVDQMKWGWPTKLNENWLIVAPFTHICGFLTVGTNPLLKSGTVFLPKSFDPKFIVEKLSSKEITVFGGGLTAIYQGLLSVEEFENSQMPYLRVCPGGGAPFPLAVHKMWQEKTGIPIYEGYGMTEIAPISVNTAQSGTKLGSVGKAVPDNVIEIVDIETGVQVLNRGETGEICVRGPPYDVRI